MNEVHVALRHLLDILAAHGRPVASHLRPGLPKEEIEQRCLAAGVTLPAEISALYQFCDGVEAHYLRSEDFCLFDFYSFMPLDWALEQQARYKEIADCHWSKDGTAYDKEAAANWFPFLYGEGDSYVVDPLAALAQKPAIISDMLEFWPEVMYTSLTTMFNTLSECYRRGAYGAALGDANDELLIAKISALHNPNVPYWQERLRELDASKYGAWE